MIVLAGGRMSSDDPLYGECPDGRRSLAAIQGKPMVQWVIDAFSDSDAVDEIIVMGLPPECSLQSSKRLHYLPDEGGIFENIRGGVRFGEQLHSERSKFMTSSADIPGIRPEMVDWLAGEMVKDPTPLIYYTVIPQSVMEKCFPEAGRSYVRFKDLTVCGGDLNAVDKTLFSRERTIWGRLTGARKHPLKQAAILGLDTLLLVALHWITLDGAVKKISRKLSLEGKALISPYAEIGMDADKPHQLEILRAALGGGQ